MKFKKLSQKQWYNGAVIACIGVAFYVLLTNFSTVMSAVSGFLGNFKVIFLGIVFAYMLNPLANLFSNKLLKKMKVGPRRWSLSVVLAAFGVAFPDWGADSATGDECCRLLGEH